VKFFHFLKSEGSLFELNRMADMDVARDEEVKTKMVPWVEKYRPEKVSDMSHQKEVVSTLLTGIETGIVPHLLFYGPPGTGKTTAILALARALYGPELYRSRILELNASDERGISVVRDKIKTFAQVTLYFFCFFYLPLQE
jgi:replication factor C subunit 2/4